MKSASANTVLIVDDERDVVDRPARKGTRIAFDVLQGLCAIFEWQLPDIH
jgi:hypothetical protein